MLKIVCGSYHQRQDTDVYNHNGKQFLHYLVKMRMNLSYDLASLLLYACLHEMFTSVYKDIYERVFTE